MIRGVQGNCLERVPQHIEGSPGSVLGLFLFLIFVNDITDNVDVLFSKISPYSDDTKIYRSILSNSGNDCDKFQDDFKMLTE